MARPASGTQHVEAARALLKNAKTSDELLLARTVLLTDHLVAALQALDADPHRVQSITAWDWFINSASNAN